MNSTFVLLTAGAGLYAVAMTFTLAALRRAPDGYEDDAGFHTEAKEL